MRIIESLRIRHAAKPRVCAVQAQSLVLYYCHHVVIVHRGIEYDSSQADLSKIVVILYCDVVIQSCSDKICFYINVVIETHTVCQLHSSNHGFDDYI